MKVKKESKQRPILKVKSESKTGESSLNKAVKDVKKILKKKNVAKADIKKRAHKTIGTENVIKVEGIEKKLKNISPKKQREPKSLERGVVYIGHIPHGFYEDQMKGFFTQFGKVTRVRVARSENTGNSKGFGYVEFELPEVAKIAAESMNNYLMCGRLVKAQYIPPAEQHKKYFKGPKWSKGNFPKLNRRAEAIKINNAPVPNKKHTTVVKKSVKRLSVLSEKLKEQGINFPIKLGKLKL